jgi:hypothetical protein
VLLTVLLSTGGRIDFGRRCADHKLLEAFTDPAVCKKAETAVQEKMGRTARRTFPNGEEGEARISNTLPPRHRGPAWAKRGGAQSPEGKAAVLYQAGSVAHFGIRLHEK